MKTLEQHVALNGSYRQLWCDYFAEHTADALNAKLQALVAGLDSESRELCAKQVELAPYFFPHPLLKKAYISDSAKRDFLPAKTADALQRAGFFDDKQDRLDRIQRELDLPLEPLPELLLHSGLTYLPKMARSLIKDRAIIDGGAFIGDTAKLFQKYYSPNRILAVEPDRESFDTLKSLVGRWRLRETILPLRYVLSDTVGKDTLWGEGVGASVIKKTSDNEITSERIRSTTVDTLVADHDIENVGLIKLDVEGSEMNAVIGAAETIKRDRPLLLISIYHTARDFFEIKPYIEQMDVGYKFLVRKISDDLLKELILICMPNGGES